MRPGPFILLIGYAAGLGLIGWTLLIADEPAYTPIDPGKVAVPTFDAPPPAVESLQAFAAIIERPLFQAGRTAPVAASPIDTTPTDVPVSSTAAKLEGFRLAAVFRRADSRRALVELPNGESLTVREGDRLENWKVLEIRDERLVLDHRGQQKTLQVHDFAYLGKPKIVPRTRALTERAKRANRRQARNDRRTPQRPRQRRRDEEREDND